METYGWLLDPKKCIECRACESACKQWNGVAIGAGVRLRQVRVKEIGAFPKIRMQALSGACNHCDDAWCVKVCATKAISRREADGTVQIDAAKCIGCRMCEEFCPHHAPQFNTVTNKMEKCTGCYDRIGLGMQPACATLCPTGALRWGKWSDIQGQGSAEWPGTPGSYTGPRIRYITEEYPSL